MNLIPPWVYWLVIAALTAALGGAHLGHVAEVATIRGAHATVLKGISDKANAALTAVLAADQANKAALAVLDLKHSKEKDDALHENNALRDAVAAGARRLRVRAVCPASGGNDLPDTSAAGSVGAEATVELSSATGRDVLDIRAGIIADQAALSYLQEYAKTCQAR